MDKEELRFRILYAVVAVGIFILTCPILLRSIMLMANGQWMVGTGLLFLWGIGMFVLEYFGYRKIMALRNKGD